MPDAGRPQRLSLRNLLRPTADAQPLRPALHGQQVWTYSRLEEEAARLARTWRARGLDTGDRVALLLPNRPEALIVYLACFKAGLAAVPLDYRYQPPQINYVLRHSGSRILVSHAERLDDVAACDEARHVELAVVGGDGVKHGAPPLAYGPAPPGGDLDAAEFRPDDVAIIFYTSGTTGRPKGVTLTRASLTTGTTKFLARVPLGRPTSPWYRPRSTGLSPSGPRFCPRCSPGGASSCSSDLHPRTTWPPSASPRPRPSWP
jgi:acyl-CoA synthetase (AMP-forming)/AMP-acid ligase II